MPSASRTSSAHVTGVAPSRRSAFVPAESALVISPGTASTSLPSSSAKSAVMSAPLRSRASTTTVARQRPAMIRFRAGNRHGAGSTPGSYSETTRPPFRDPSRELSVRRRVVAVDPAAEDRDGDTPGVERSPVCLGVDPACQPAHDHDAGAHELAGERSRDGAPVRGAGTSPDDRDGESRQGAPGLRLRAGRGSREGRGSQREAPGTRRRRAGAAGSHSRRQLGRHAVRERLGDVRGLDPLGPAQRRDRAGDPRHADAAYAPRAAVARRRSTGAPTQPRCGRAGRPGVVPGRR